MAITREAFIDRRQPMLRWGAVIAGGAVAIGLWILLQVLGTGVGLATVDPDDTGTLRGAGIGTGIWSVIAPLIALFSGGYLAARLSGTVQRGIGAVHGLVLWSLTIVLGLMSLFGVISGLTRSAVELSDQAVMTGAIPWDEVEGAAPSGPAAERQAAVAADKAGKVMMWTGLGLLLSLGAAAGGGAIGARTRRRDLDLDDRGRRRTITPARGVGVPVRTEVVEREVVRGDPVIE